MLGHLFIWGTVALTVYGQLVVKWRVSLLNPLPSEPMDKVWALLGLIPTPWVLSSLSAAFLAFLCWLAAMTRFPLSVAYPYQTSLTFALVVLFSLTFLGETLTLIKGTGLALILLGIFLASR